MTKPCDNGASIPVVVAANECSAHSGHESLRRDDIFRAIVESASDWICEIDTNDAYSYSNPRSKKLLGYEPAELIGRRYFELLRPSDAATVVAAFERFKVHRKSFGRLENTLISRDGREIVVETSAVPIFAEDGSYMGYRGVGRDITELKKAEAALRFNETRFSDVLRMAHAGYWEYDVRTDCFAFNDNFYRIFRTTAEEVGGYVLRSAEYARRFVHPDDMSIVGTEVKGAIETKDPGYSREFEHRMVYADGTFGYIVVRFLIVKDAEGRTVKTYGVNQDITERRLAEEKIRESEAKFRGLVEQNLAGIAIVRHDGTLAYINPYLSQLIGYKPAELIGRSFVEFLPDSEKPIAEKVLSQHLSGKGGIFQFESRLQTRSGSAVEFLVNVSPAEYEGRPASIGTSVDITERKKSQRALDRVNRALRTLSRGNEVVIRAGSEMEVFNEMCRVVVESGGYRMAWIAMVEHDEARSVKIVAGAGEGAQRLARQGWITWAETPSGGCTVGRAIRTGEPQTSQDFLADLRMAPWTRFAKEYGIGSVASLPLKDHSGVFAVLAIHAAEPNAFDAEELKLLGELADDLSFGVVALRERHQNAVLEARWRASLSKTIGAIASTVEIRDPYTAGHQQRVATLARAIGQALGMPEHDTEGLYLAGMIHDVGKISVPAEILSKPGKLSELEIAIVRGHAEAGYAIVKGVDLPWPIAEMVRQHHERLDGSGYPRALKGDTILVGAKILAVADVVDAMMEHRPYRPALGLDAALAEIEQNKGRLFDPAAVDACIALFREKKFTFDTGTRSA